MKVIWPAIFFAMIVVSSYATSVTVTTTNLQTKSGILHNVYFQTASGPGSATPGTNTALTPSGTSGSYSVAAGTSGYLWSPSFSTATTIPASTMTLDIWASTPATSISLDGSNSGTGTTSAAAALTTTKTNDVIYVIVGTCPSTGTITPSATGLTFTSRGSTTRTGGMQNCASIKIQAFYAISSPTLSVLSISASVPSATDTIIHVSGVSGANTASPFDSHAGIPATASGTGTAATVSISTSNAHDLIIGGDVDSGTSLGTAGTGYTLIQRAATANMASLSEYQTVTTVQTNLAVPVTAAGGADIWAMIADAVVAAPISMTMQTTNSAGTLVSTLLSSATTGPILPSQSQIINRFSISTGSIPANGYIAVILTAPNTAAVTIYWGVGQPTNFQVPRVLLT